MTAPRDLHTSTVGAADAYARHHSDFEPDDDLPSLADVQTPDPPRGRPHPGWCVPSDSGLDQEAPF